MTAYAIMTSDVHDGRRLMAEYVPTAARTVGEHGGRIVAAGSQQHAPEGGGLRARNMIMEFPGIAEAISWYADPAYEEVAAVRHEVATTSIVAMDGLTASLGGAFVIATMDILDPQAFVEQYIPPTLATIDEFGGQMLAVGGTTVGLEGEDFRSRTVAFEFANMDTAMAWYHSESYAPLIELRKKCTEGDLIILSAE